MVLTNVIKLFHKVIDRLLMPARVVARPTARRRKPMRKIASKVLALPKALILGFAVQILGIMPFVVLVQLNLQATPALPWAVAAEVVILAVLFAILSGRIWPKAWGEVRRAYLRFNPIPREFAPWVVVTSAVYGATIIALSLVSYLLFPFPEEAGALFFGIKETPAVTAIAILAAVAVATGLVEETAYRGYMQVPLERAYGPAAAILIAAIAFALSHPVPTVWLPVFVFGSLGWGLLSRLTNSTIPGIVTHTVVDAALFAWIYFNIDGFRAILQSNVIETGPTQAFMTAAAAAVVLTILSVGCFVQLARIARNSSKQEPGDAATDQTFVATR